MKIISKIYSEKYNRGRNGALPYDSETKHENWLPMDGEGTIKAKSERLGAKAMANFFWGDTQNILFANS